MADGQTNAADDPTAWVLEVLSKAVAAGAAYLSLSTIVPGLDGSATTFGASVQKPTAPPSGGRSGTLADLVGIARTSIADGVPTLTETMVVEQGYVAQIGLTRS